MLSDSDTGSQTFDWEMSCIAVKHKLPVVRMTSFDFHIAETEYCADIHEEHGEVSIIMSYICIRAIVSCPSAGDGHLLDILPGAERRGHAIIALLPFPSSMNLTIITRGPVDKRINDDGVDLAGDPLQEVVSLRDNTRIAGAIFIV